MRKLALVAVILALITSSVSAYSAETAPQVQKKPLVAVIPFDFANSRAAGITSWLTLEFCSELSQTGRFGVLDTNGVTEVLKKNSIRTVGLLTKDEAVMLGSLVKCRYIVCGIVDDAVCTRSYSGGYRAPVSTSDVADVRVRYTILDAQTGEVWKSHYYTESATDSVSRGTSNTNYLMEKAARYSAYNFVKDLIPPIQSKVVSIDVKGIIIDIGSAHGVVDGTEFHIIPAVSEPGQNTVEPILAHVDIASIQNGTCRLIPGYWKKSGRLISKWKWNADTSKLKDIKQGMVVMTAEPKH